MVIVAKATNAGTAMRSQKRKYRIRREKAKERKKVRAIPKILKIDLADSTSAKMGAN
jgi:hypothetical protein